MTDRLVIESEGKGRSFSALVLARVYAPCAWEAGIRERDRHRPAMLLLGCADEEAGALRANLLEGRKMRLHGERFGHKGEPCEILRSERFAIGVQKTEAGTLLLVRHPALFVFSPGLVSDDVRFVCLPPRRLLDAQASQFGLAATRDHLAACGFEPWTQEREQVSWHKPVGRLVRGLDDPLFPAFAALLVASVAQRVGFPIVDDPLFWAQLAAALIEAGIAHRCIEKYDFEIAPYGEAGVVESGFYPGAAVATSQAKIGEVLARETASFLRR